MALSIECRAYTEGPPLTVHLINIAKAIFLIALVDVLVLRRFFPDQKTRWFALHCLVNAAVVVGCVPDMVELSARPLCVAVEPPASYYPGYYAWGLHAYHLAAYTDLRLEDFVHHVLFAGLLGPFNYSYEWGRMTNLLVFFMTGLPGGIDYGCLVLVKSGRLNRIYQKSICSTINNWCRVPGLVATATLMASVAMHGAIRAPGWVVAIVTCLCLLNGLYYGEQAIGTYHRLAALSPTHKDKQVGEIFREAVNS